MNKRSNGFSAVEVVIAIVIIGLIIALGWVLYDKQLSKSNGDTQTNTSVQQDTNSDASNVTTKTSDIYAAQIPSDWVKKTDTVTGASFASPAGWNDTVKVERFTVDEGIAVGYGAPVQVRYLSSAEVWQTVDSDDNGAFTVVRSDSDNLVSVSDVKAENMYDSATYTTGDGTGAQLVVLVKKNTEVYRFALPATCQDVICEGDKQWTLSEIKAAVPQFIKTITLK